MENLKFEEAEGMLFFEGLPEGEGKIEEVEEKEEKIERKVEFKVEVVERRKN